MRNSISDPRQFIIPGCRLIIVIAFIFASQMVSAQQKFTIQLTNGTNLQVPVEGLKLTFDNNGSFTCWQNGVKQDMTFASVGKIYFTNLILPTRIDENNSISKSLKIYPNPIRNEINIEIEGKTEAIGFEIINAGGQIVFRGMVLEKTVVKTESFSPGVYLIKVKNGAYFETKKIVKE